MMRFLTEHAWRDLEQWYFRAKKNWAIFEKENIHVADDQSDCRDHK